MLWFLIRFRPEEKCSGFDGFSFLYGNHVQTWNLTVHFRWTSKLFEFVEMLVCRLSVTDSRVGINTWSTSQIDFSTQSECMDKPFWGMINRETISRNLPRIWPLTVFWIFKNSNFENSWIWWLRQGVNKISRFEYCKRSRVMRRCAQMS